MIGALRFQRPDKAEHLLELLGRPVPQQGDHCRDPRIVGGEHDSRAELTRALLDLFQIRRPSSLVQVWSTERRSDGGQQREKRTSPGRRHGLGNDEELLQPRVADRLFAEQLAGTELKALGDCLDGIEARDLLSPLHDPDVIGRHADPFGQVGLTPAPGQTGGTHAGAESLGERRSLQRGSRRSPIPPLLATNYRHMVNHYRVATTHPKGVYVHWATKGVQGMPSDGCSNGIDGLASKSFAPSHVGEELPWGAGGLLPYISGPNQAGAAR